MPIRPAFELFETVCQELTNRAEIILPDDELPNIVEDLKEEYQETTDLNALTRAIDYINEHFQAKGSRLPFAFDAATGRFSRLDEDYVNFISLARESRGIGGIDSKHFETRTLNRLTKRLTGQLSRVGVPRETHKKKVELEEYLLTLGFEKNSLEKYDKDGGLDLLWLPPLGAVPIRPVVSFQCKNASFSESTATESAGRALRTFARHSYSRGRHHLVFVVFNDYIDETYAGRGRGWIFLPLGLSDLGDLVDAIETRLL